MLIQGLELHLTLLANIQVMNRYIKYVATDMVGHNPRIKSETMNDEFQVPLPHNTAFSKGLEVHSSDPCFSGHLQFPNLSSF